MDPSTSKNIVKTEPPNTNDNESVVTHPEVSGAWGGDSGIGIENQWTHTRIQSEIYEATDSDEEDTRSLRMPFVVKSEPQPQELRTEPQEEIIKVENDLYSGASAWDPQSSISQAQCQYAPMQSMDHRQHAPKRGRGDERSSAQDREGEDAYGHCGNKYRKTPRYFQTDKYDFNNYMRPEVKNLAIHRYKNQILHAVNKNQVTVVQGYTGCGKTTQIPQFILDDCIKEEAFCKIIVTQPRKLAAITTAKRVCVERGWELGTVAGYSVGLDTHTCTDTLITYETTGILLKQLVESKSINKTCSHVIIDEVHERDLDTDFLLLIIKKILLDDKHRRRRDREEEHVKIILMSATISAEKFADYFKFGDDTVPIIRVDAGQKTSYTVDEVYLDDLHGANVNSNLGKVFDDRKEEGARMYDELYEVIVNLIASLDDYERSNSLKSDDTGRNSTLLESRGSVLVFLPGIREIDILMKALKQRVNGSQPSNRYKWNIIPLHSSISADDQAMAFGVPEKGVRKIILSTNIAESSVTVPDVVYVMDSCLTKSQNVDTSTNYNCLRMEWASKSQCIQRRGRTGRVAPGIVYRLVPKNHFLNALPNDATPDMLKSELSSIVLHVKRLEMGNPAEVLALAIDPPYEGAIERAVASLKEAGGLTILLTLPDETKVYDKRDGDLTHMGRIMSDLPMSHQFTRLIMFGHVLGCMHDCIVIAASLCVKNPFKFPMQRKLDAYVQKFEFAGQSFSDLFALLNVYKRWAFQFAGANDSREDREAEKRWGVSAFVHTGILREVRMIIEETTKRLSKYHIEEFPAQHDEDDVPISLTDDQKLLPTKEQTLKIKIAIAAAFYPNYFRRHLSDAEFYERQSLKEVAEYDLFSTVYFKKFPSGRKGSIYGKHISEQMQFGNDIPKIIIPEQGEKVFVNFEFSTARLGPISLSVYRSLKRWQLREKVSFMALMREEERDYYYQALAEYNSLFDQCTPCPTAVQLPGVKVPQFSGRVTYADSPSNFYMVYVCHNEKLGQMTDDINRNLSNIQLPEHLHLEGTMCLAKYGDHYYRAKICLIAQDQLLVQYVDFGNTRWLGAQDLQVFSLEHNELHITTFPMLAVPCKLARLKPSTIFGSVWYTKAIAAFKTRESKISKMVVYGVSNGVISGELLIPESQDLNINNWLQTHNFAQLTRHESQNCEANRRIRLNLSMYNPGRVEAIDREQIAKPEQKMLKSPTNGTEAVELVGPFSPLEMEFRSVCQSSSNRKVWIEKDSVNSVSLDHEPSATTSRLLIAASISVQDQRKALSARDTTLMPAIPGILGLISMLFAPKAELRLDDAQTSYISAICGLGTDENGQSIYPDHDVEIMFDAEFDDKDISDINLIRHAIDVIFSGNGNGNYGVSLHTDIITTITALLQKYRPKMGRDVPSTVGFKWGTVPPENRIPLFPADIQPGLRDIYTPIMGLRRIRPQSTRNVSWDFPV